MLKLTLKIILALTMVVLIPPITWGAGNEKTIRIGFNIPLSGENPNLGESSRNAAEMYLKANRKIVVGGRKYALEFIYVDNEYKPSSALKATTILIKRDKVLGIIGPQASGQAIPAGGLANSFKTPMISPWSTNPKTTQNRPYVFRAAFLDPFQGPILTVFSAEELGARKAAVLYDISADYSRGLARYFKTAFERLLGKGTVVAFEHFNTGDKDFSSQLVKIITSDADVLFVPQYYSEVPLIVKSAKEMGWNKPILGSDSWGSGDLASLCGDSCNGYYFATHYAAIGAEGITKAFINAYKSAYDKIPDDVAALTWDALGLMIQAIKNTGGLSNDIEADRMKVKDGLVAVKKYPGVTGRITLTPQGDPRKCAVIAKINNAGQFEFHQSICPR